MTKRSSAKLITNYELQITNYELRITKRSSAKLMTNYKLGIEERWGRFDLALSFLLVHPEGVAANLPYLPVACLLQQLELEVVFRLVVFRDNQRWTIP